MLKASKDSSFSTCSSISPCKSGSFKEHTADDSLLLETPHELCCPITQDIFKDPVITTAGQVYERAAIVEALQHSSRDPITGVDIAPAQLTPVYLLRKSAQEYRDSSAKACIEKVCSTDCDDPVKYLRRAAELYSGCTLSVPGLTTECIQYLQTHQSNAYDVYALQIFAQGLRRGGYHDLAANVFHKLLQMGEDKAQQAEILKQCLQCWVIEHASSDQDLAISKLTEFIRSHQTLSWAQIIDIMSEANISMAYIVQTCEALLLQPADGDDNRQVKELMLKYTQLSMNAVDSRVRDHDARLSVLENSSCQKLPAVTESLSRPDRPKGQPLQFPLSRKKLVTSAALVLLNVIDCKHFLWRLFRTVPLLMLIHDDEK